jgi:hypothetical protein
VNDAELLIDAETRIAALEAERQILWDRIVPLQQQVTAISNEVSVLAEKRDTLIVKAQKQQSEPDWKMLVSRGHTNRSTRALDRYFEGLLADRFDMRSDGYWSDTQEAALRLKVECTDESEAKNLAGVKLFASICTPVDGYVRFGIFENSLSVNGGYTLYVRPDLSELKIERRFREPVVFDSPEKALAYVRANLYYGEPG